jgi:succinate dehydrogenase / fumarate reductase cytochrome b subunit
VAYFTKSGYNPVGRIALIIRLLPQGAAKRSAELSLLDRQNFLLRRLHSLTGVVPVGAFLVEHFLTNSFALGGEESYNEKVAFLTSLPYLYVIEALFIFLPIIFHGVLGMWIVFSAEVSVARHRYLRNWLYFFQRVSGVFLVAYIAVHVWTTRFAGEENLFRLMEHKLSSPAWLWFYIAGVTAATFHFANGLWGFMVTWGITVSPRAQKWSTYACAGVFLAMTFVGVNALLAFTGDAVTFLQKQ